MYSANCCAVLQWDEALVNTRPRWAKSEKVELPSLCRRWPSCHRVCVTFSIVPIVREFAIQILLPKRPPPAQTAPPFPLCKTRAKANEATARGHRGRRHYNAGGETSVRKPLKVDQCHFVSNSFKCCNLNVFALFLGIFFSERGTNNMTNNSQ